MARKRLEEAGETFDDLSSERHHLAITTDPAAYESLLPLLTQLPAPALLITGGQDPVTSARPFGTLLRTASCANSSRRAISCTPTNRARTRPPSPHSSGPTGPGNRPG